MILTCKNIFKKYWKCK